MDKLSQQRQQSNLKILDLLKGEIIKRPELRFGQLLYSVGILKSHTDEETGIQVTDDIFYTESSDMLKCLKDKLTG